MRFYRIDGNVNKIECSCKNDEIENYLRGHHFASEVKSKTEDFNEQYSGRTFFSLVNRPITTFVVCLLTNFELDIGHDCKCYLQKLGIVSKEIIIEEITFQAYIRMLRNADRSDFIEDYDEILDKFEVNALRPGDLNCKEEIFETRARKKDDADCAHLLTNSVLKEEIERINSSKKTENVYGHPVHYLITCDDEQTKEKSYEILLNNLIKNGRLSCKRVFSIDLEYNVRVFRSTFAALFKMNSEGTLIVNFNKFHCLDGDLTDSSFESINILCENIKKFRNDVLVILLLPKECTQLKNILYKNLGCLSFIEIDEIPADNKRSKQILKNLAKNKSIQIDNKLFAKLEANKTYLTKELRIIFEEWFSDKLKTDIYPQYSGVKVIKSNEINKAAKGTGYEELMSLIGLGGAKKLINQAIDFHKVQKYMSAQDVVRERPSQHMVFSGNPGTAKTTVARLFARIMRENELISSGHILEVGRGDLVGKYVGHTADLVKEAFDKAKGGVLFIDEAYSLVDDRSGSFGDEAINTIVQEMENNRDNVIVIFAGYPDKMEEFLQRNPGLRSRIAFHVPFDDYSTEELSEIADLIAKKKKMQLSEDATKKLGDIFDCAREQVDFGNGRFVRSTLEKAMMAQASRIVKNDMDTLNKTQLCTLIAEDIEMPEVMQNKRLKVGFRQ